MRVSARIDSILAPDREALDGSQSPACTRDYVCDPASASRAQYASGEQPLLGVRNDDTCEAWQCSDRPGEAWRCLDPTYVLLNQHLALDFEDEAREHERLIARAEAFQHLTTLDLGTAAGPLSHPTRETLRAALRQT